MALLQAPNSIIHNVFNAYGHRMGFYSKKHSGNFTTMCLAENALSPCTAISFSVTARPSASTYTKVGRPFAIASCFAVSQYAQPDLLLHTL